MSEITLRNVSKRYGNQPVLVDLDLTIADTTITAILGPSGSGKTTLLRLIAGFERTDGGTITIADETVDGDRMFVAPQHRHVGYVPQDAGLFPHLNVRRNIAFGAGRRRADHIDTLIEIVGLAGLERRFPHQLSGGQRQRVALARALAVEPRVVLLDEPFGSLDAALRESLRSEVAHILHNLNATAVLVTHDQNEALSFADHVAVLRGGQIAASATPRALYRMPPDPATARFVGDSNVLDGEVVGTEIRTPLGNLPAPVGAEQGQCSVLVRPEQISLTADAGSVDDGSLAAQRGVVTSINYYGHDARVVIRLDAADITVRVPGDRDLEKGQHVLCAVIGPVLTWPRHR